MVSTKDTNLTMRNILVIDDVEMNRDIVTKVFKNRYNVLTAENGAVGLQILHEHEIDLVLLDVQMPVMDGFDVLKAMKEDKALSYIPVIVITSEIGQAERKAFDLGADDFLEQPYDAHIMRKRVENLIDRYDLVKRLETALNAAKNANQSKSEFLSRVSHDMRTPLNVILSIARLVPEERPSYEVLLSYFKDINNEGSFLLNLINDVLDMQKIDSGVIELKPESVDLADVIGPVVEQANHLAKEKNIEFTMEIRGFIENARAIMDPLRVQQLLNNLISNAIKYTPEDGKVEMIIENLSYENNVSTDRIIIRDNGRGMSEEFIKRMYEPFTQENGGSTSTTRGTGLGLSIVKKIVDIMGGTITCKSEIGKGTEFNVVMTIPLVVEEEKASVEKVSYIFKDNADLMGRRILLCEDHPMNAIIAKKILTRKGIIVTHAENGQLGLEQFKNSTVGYYDAILMDVRMPVMDGLETTKAIRALSRSDAKTVPIIAMTANAYNEDIKACIEAGMNEHLAKPVEPQAIWKALYKYIDFSKKIEKLKVIVVDDVEVNRIVIAEAINDEYEPIMATCGEEALQFLAKYSDVIAVITDIMMPEMNGQELIRAIREKREYDSIAILANTQYGKQEQEEMVLKAGADDFIYKPTTPMIVKTRLANVLMHRNYMTK